MFRRSFWFAICILLLFNLIAACTQSNKVLSTVLPTSNHIPPTQTQPLPTYTPFPSATSMPLPTATPTPLALVQKELSLIGIRGSDLPSGFIEIISTTNVDDMDLFFDDFDSSYLYNCYLSEYQASDPERGVFSVIWVYANEFLASKVYSSWSQASSYGETIVEVPLIGSERIATVGEDNAFIIWRYREAVAWIVMSGDQQPKVNEMVRLAQLVQKRMNEQQVARVPTPTVPYEAPTEPQPPLSTTEAPITSTPGLVEMGMSRSNPYPVGEVVHTPYWEFSVLEVVRGIAAWQALITADPDISPAPEGKEYLALRINVKCVYDDSETHRIDFTDFLVTGDHNELYRFTVAINPSPSFDTHELHKGEEVKGWITYLIGKGERNLIMLLKKYTETYDELIMRFVALEEGASVRIPSEMSNIQPNNLGIEINDPAPIGETVITENWEVTILEMARGNEAWKMIQATSSVNDPPLQTGEYIAVRVHILYIGTIDKDVEGVGLQFGILDSQNITYGTANLIDVPEPALYADLYPGGEAEGWVIFQIPRDESNLRIIFDTFHFDENPRYLSLQQ